MYVICHCVIVVRRTQFFSPFGFTPLDDKTFPKWKQLLKERICMPRGAKSFELISIEKEAKKKVCERVASPESMCIHLKLKFEVDNNKKQFKLIIT